LHGILHEGHHFTDLKVGGINLLGTKPDDQDDGQVHDQHHEGHQDDHDSIDKQQGIRQIAVGFIKSFGFEFLVTEGSDNHQAA